MLKDQKQNINPKEVPLSVKGSFEDLVKVSVIDTQIKKVGIKKAAKKKDK